ncbi:MAG: heme o synthase [Roseiflexaceae bacterium]
MQESLPTLAPSNRVATVLAVIVACGLIVLPVFASQSSILVPLIAVVALLVATLAWVYTAPLRWPSVALLLSTMPMLGWPTLHEMMLIPLLTAGYVLSVAIVPEMSTQRLGARAEAARRQYRILAVATIVSLMIVSLLGGLGSVLCSALPLCTDSSNLAQLQNSHRIISVPAGILTLILVIQTLRTYGKTWSVVTRMSLAVVIGMTAQLLVGLGVANALIDTTIHASLSLLTLGLVMVLAATTWRGVWPTKKLDVSTPEMVTIGDAVVAYTWREKIKDYVSLTKPGVISLLILTTITSMYITPEGMPSLSLVLWTSIGGWLMAAASHSFNCYLDRDIDILMGRTGRRPIPSGRIPGWHAIVLGFVLMIAATAILVLAVNWLSAALAFAGLVYYVLIYTMWLKRTSFNNIVIGGGAGAFPPLVGWAAVTGSLSLPSLFLFAIIFYWTPPHFWALAIIRQKDYARAGVPMLPVVAGDQETRWQIVLYTILMFIVTIMPTPLQMLGVAYLVMASVLGVVFAYYAVRLYKEGTTTSAWGLYRFSLLYLALLFGAMVIDRVYFV